MLFKVDQKNFIKSLGLGIVMVGLMWLAFDYGNRQDNLVSTVINKFSGDNLMVYLSKSTKETTDIKVESIIKSGNVGVVDDLQLRVVQAWRVSRPRDAQDLGVLEVELRGTDDCGDVEDEDMCTFQRSKFKLIDRNGKMQSVSPPPNKFIRGLRITQLANERTLSPLSSESGQIYFLLDKGVDEFTLVYGEGKFEVEAEVYGGF